MWDWSSELCPVQLDLAEKQGSVFFLSYQTLLEMHISLVWKLPHINVLFTCLLFLYLLPIIV